MAELFPVYLCYGKSPHAKLHEDPASFSHHRKHVLLERERKSLKGGQRRKPLFGEESWFYEFMLPFPFCFKKSLVVDLLQSHESDTFLAVMQTIQPFLISKDKASLSARSLLSSISQRLYSCFPVSTYNITSLS